MPPQTLLGITLSEGSNFIICLLAAFPLALLQNTLQRTTTVSPTIIHLLSILSTAGIMILMFDFNAVVWLGGSAMTVWTLAQTMPHRPWISFLIIFCILSFVQARSQLWPVEGWVDFASMMMVMIIKLTSYAYCCYDGTRPADTWDEYQKLYAIRDQPNVIEFMGYAFNLVGFWVGPGLEFMHYRRYTSRQAPYDKLPSTYLPTLKPLFIGLSMVYLHETFQNTYHFSHCASPEFLARSFWSKILYIMLSGLIVRSKFHCAWKVSEASAVLSGMGYGKDEKGVETFKFAENVDIMGVEMGGSPKEMMDSWNKFTANWLRRYVYMRVKIGALKLPATFFVSAFWHGFYPGYYTTFLSSVLMTENARVLRRSIRPFFLAGSLRFLKPLYDVASTVLSMFCLNYLVVSFILRRADYVYEAWSSIYFIGHVIMLVPFLLLNVFGLGKAVSKFHPVDPKAGVKPAKGKKKDE